MPAGIGANSCPFEVGEPVCWEDTIRLALSEDYERVFDMSEGTIAAAEAMAEARCIANIWAASERLQNQALPLKMIEALPVWERATKTRVPPGATARARREAIAAKFLQVGNAEPDLRGICAAGLGRAFVELRHVSDAEATRYWPGINPGPPGFEWMSTEAQVLVRTQRAGMSDDEFRRRVQSTMGAVDDVLAGECTADWFRWDTDGTEEGFFLDVSELDEVGL